MTQEEVAALLWKARDARRALEKVRNAAKARWDEVFEDTGGFPSGDQYWSALDAAASFIEDELEIKLKDLLLG